MSFVPNHSVQISVDLKSGLSGHSFKPMNDSYCTHGRKPDYTAPFLTSFGSLKSAMRQLFNDTSSSEKEQRFSYSAFVIRRSALTAY